jgi:hypothetical protein
MLDGVHPIFIIPPLVLLVAAILVGLSRFSKEGAGSAFTSVVRIIVYGAFVLFVLFFIWAGLYYAGGGH